MSRFVCCEEFWDIVNKDISINGERTYSKNYLETDFGKVNYNFFATGKNIVYGEFEGLFNRDTILEGTSGERFIFLCFNTGAQVNRYQKLEDKKAVSFEQNCFWSGEQFGNGNSYGQFSKEQHYRSHYLMFEKEFFNSLLDEETQYKLEKNSKLIDDFSINFTSKMNAKQQTLLNEIKSFQGDGTLKEIYLESKILDLTFNTVELISNKKEESGVKLSSDDLKSLNLAKEILLTNISNPPSIKELAHKSSINEFKLKKGFKELFGNTVYGLLQEERLILSKDLLERGDISIKEACAEIGYNSVSHFSKIFKERFGILPMQIKQSRSFYI